MGIRFGTCKVRRLNRANLSHHQSLSRHGTRKASSHGFKSLYMPFLQVNCTGNETRLEYCDHPAWGNHSCGHFEDAGVRCVGPDTTRECVDECGDGYFKVKGKMECGVCMASCLTCANSASNCTSCDRPRFLKGNACEL